MEIFFEFLQTTGFASMTIGNLIMILIGIGFVAACDHERLRAAAAGADWHGCDRRQHSRDRRNVAGCLQRERLGQRR